MRLHQQTCGRDTCSRLELGLASLEASKCEATSCQDTAIGLANLAAVLDSLYEQVSGSCAADTCAALRSSVSRLQGCMAGPGSASCRAQYPHTAALPSLVTSHQACFRGAHMIKWHLQFI